MQTIVSVRTIEVNRRKYAFHSDAAELRMSQCGPCADHQNSCHQQRSVQLNEAGRACNGDLLPGGDAQCRVGNTDHRGDAVLTRDNGAV